MKGVRLDDVLAVLGSHQRGLCYSGVYAIPMDYESKRHGGAFTFAEDSGPIALGPLGFDEGDLQRVFSDAKLCILVSRDVTPTEARVIETLMLAHLEPDTVIIRTEPEHHVEWARWVRRLSGRGPVMHVLGSGVELEDLAAPQGPSACVGEGLAFRPYVGVHAAPKGLH